MQQNATLHGAKNACPYEQTGMPDSHWPNQRQPVPEQIAPTSFPIQDDPFLSGSKETLDWQRQWFKPFNNATWRPDTLAKGAKQSRRYSIFCLVLVSAPVSHVAPEWDSKLACFGLAFPFWETQLPDPSPSFGWGSHCLALNSRSLI